ncbi:MAG TPA: class I SAM-dependent methyltransferase, partial [Candidatus Paceibacterota bacterium]|nr:class I SAM-dependent methyltransferase [Candidatus Paceibacterota bacterium]
MFGLKDDDIVADLGAGTGFYSLAAGYITERGKVYAIEIAKEFLQMLKSKVKDARLRNVEIIWGNIEKSGGTQLGDDTMDKAIISNVFSQIEDKEQFILETKRILKTKGRVLFVDWSPLSFMAQKKSLPKDKVFELFEKKGFILERDINVGG